MTTAWRLVKATHAEAAFSGEGARRYGGRWNHPGTPIVYLSGSLALAALEQFVHLPAKGARIQFVVFRVTIPDDVAIESPPPGSLPANWREEPPPAETKELGTGWVERGSAAVFRLPSVVVPRESNYALNPAHREFAKIEIGPAEEFSFDPRMWK